MINQSKLISKPTKPALSSRRPSAGPRSTSAAARPVRIARGSQVIGKWSFAEVRERLKTEVLHPTDSFYDEDNSEWLLLSELEMTQTSVCVEKAAQRPCYCGTGLSFHLCCGDGRQY
ncbi:MAG: hypothetical protein ABIP20_00835 [Chthoniobacteraceae bacterium]